MCIYEGEETAERVRSLDTDSGEGKMWVNYNEVRFFVLLLLMVNRVI